MDGAARGEPAWVEAFEVEEGGGGVWRVEVACGERVVGGVVFEVAGLVEGDAGDGVSVLEMGKGKDKGKAGKGKGNGGRASFGSSVSGEDGGGGKGKGVVVLTAERVVPSRPAHLYALNVRLGKGVKGGGDLFYVVYRAVRGGGDEFTPVYRSEVVCARAGARFAPAIVRSERLIAGDENRRLRVVFFGKEGRGSYVEWSVGCLKYAKEGGVLEVVGEGGMGGGRCVLAEKEVGAVTRGGVLRSRFVMVVDGVGSGKRRSRGDWVDVDEDGRHAAKMQGARANGGARVMGVVPKGVSYMTARADAIMEVRRSWAANRDARLVREREEAEAEAEAGGSPPGVERDSCLSPPVSPMSSVSLTSVAAGGSEERVPRYGLPPLPPPNEKALVRAVRERRGMTPPKPPAGSHGNLGAGEQRGSSWERGGVDTGSGRTVKQLMGLFSAEEEEGEVEAEGTTVTDYSDDMYGDGVGKVKLSEYVPLDEDSDSEASFEQLHEPSDYAIVAAQQRRLSAASVR